MPYKDKRKQKKAQRESYLRNKPKIRQRHRRQVREIQRWIQTVKEATPCSDCKKFFPYYVMQFDHRLDKNFKINRAHRERTRKEIEKEIEKCDLVCANCHAVRTYLRHDPLWVFGRVGGRRLPVEQNP